MAAEPQSDLPGIPPSPAEPELELPTAPSPASEPEPDPPSASSSPAEQPSRKRKLKSILPSPPQSPGGDTPLPSPPGDDGSALWEEDEPELPTLSSWSGEVVERPRKRARTRTTTTPVTNPTRPYAPPTAYAKAMKRLMEENQVREYQRAEALFRRARHPIHGSVFADSCRKQVARIIEAVPSEVVEGKCYMMLARRELGLDAYWRVSRAEKAIAAWKRVISREGHSKFPLARMGLALAPELLAHAEEAVAQEESSDSS